MDKSIKCNINYSNEIFLNIYLTKLNGIGLWIVFPGVETDKFLTNSDINQSFSLMLNEPKDEHWDIKGQSDGVPNGRQACDFKILFMYDWPHTGSKCFPGTLEMKKTLDSNKFSYIIMQVMCN